MTENNFIERQSDSAGMGQWAVIQKTEWQQLSNDAWRMPTTEQGIISASRGLLVGVGVSVVAGGFLAIGNSLAGFDLASPLVALPVGIVAGLGYALYDFQENIAKLFQLYRDRMTRQELYERETKAAAMQSNERVTLEVIERQGNNAGRIVYDVLDIDSHNLAIVARDNTTLSKRGLMSLGFSDTSAMTLLQKMLETGYITRTSGNAPAQWTSKGRALVKAFGGGGGGGGALETSENTNILEME